MIPDLATPEATVRQAISQVFTDESIEHWLTTPNQLTGGVSPRAALAAGNLKLVARAVNLIRTLYGCGPWPEPIPGGKIDARRETL